MLKYSKIIDLTIPITTGMDMSPGTKATTPQVEFEIFRSHEQSNIQLGIYRTPIHVGTHLDTPLHIFPDGLPMEQVPLNHWMGEAFCVDLHWVKPNHAITAKDLADNTPELAEGMILLIHTGWSDKMYGNAEYWSESPFLTPEAAQWMVDKKVKLGGYDFFQDEGPKALKLDPSSFKVHRIMLANGCYNCEHLTNLGEIAGKKVFFMALPLSIPGAEGTPTRAVALV